jgi:adenylate cyclase
MSSGWSGVVAPPARLPRGRGLPDHVFEMRRTLRFSDARVERSFQDQYFRDNVGYVRTALLFAIGVWAFFGLLPLLTRGSNVVADEGMAWHLVVTLGAGAGVASLSLASTFVRSYARWWQWAIVALVLVSTSLADIHRIVTRHPETWTGVVNLMLVLAFTYVLFRLQYPYAALGGVLVIAYYNVIRVIFVTAGDVELLLPDLYLFAFAVAGTSGAFVLERFARLLFLRERQLDRERERGDALLRNILPEAIIDRLKTLEPDTEDARIAEWCPDVTVLFADLVGFTAHAADIEPDVLVVTLDQVFARLDQLADQCGLEKIKTIGDAYLAVAGVPRSRSDHVEAAVEMALGAREGLSDCRWPDGEALSVRIGIACGPVVAGVIGHRKFAYDVWGDTVNLASRLESAAAPGSILVSDAVFRRLRSKYLFAPPRVLDLKGKGHVKAHTLLASTSAAPDLVLA